MYDIDLIMSWTPKQFQSLLKGRKLAIIDDYDYMANLAMAIGYASRAKKPRKNKIFDAQKAKRELEGQQPDRDRIKKLYQAFKGFDFEGHFREKR